MLTSLKHSPSLNATMIFMTTNSLQSFLLSLSGNTIFKAPLSLHDALPISPNPRLVLFGKEHKRIDDVGVIRDEFPIEICEAKEGTDSFDRGGGFPCVNGR